MPSVIFRVFVLQTHLRLSSVTKMTRSNSNTKRAHCLANGTLNTVPTIEGVRLSNKSNFGDRDKNHVSSQLILVMTGHSVALQFRVATGVKQTERRKSTRD